LTCGKLVSGLPGSMNPDFRVGLPLFRLTVDFDRRYIDANHGSPIDDV
jgi:hypothetical protein